MKWKQYLILILSTCLVVVTPAISKALIINEIYFDPAMPVGDDDGEFIELFNENTIPLDLTDYTISGVSASFDSLIIDPGGFVVLTREPIDDGDSDPYNFESLYGNGDGILDEFSFPVVKFTGSLSNSGELLTVYGPGGDVIDTYNYMAFVNSDANGNGFSIERIDPYTETIDSNFAVSIIMGGSPGKWNSIAPLQENETSPVPEPSTLLLMITGLIYLRWRWLRA